MKTVSTKPPPRQRTMISVEVDPELKERVERCRLAQEFPPSLTTMVSRALKLLCDRMEARGA